MARSSKENKSEDVLADRSHEQSGSIDQTVSYCTYLCVSLNTNAIDKRAHSTQNSSNSLHSTEKPNNSSHFSDSSKMSNNSHTSDSSNSLNSTNSSNVSHCSNSFSPHSSHASRSTGIPPASSLVNCRLPCATNLLGAHPLDTLSVPTASRAIAFSDQLRNCRSRPCSPPPATYIPARRPSLSLPPSPRSGRMHRASLPFLTATFPHRGDQNAASSSDLRAPSVSPSISRRRSPRRTARTPSPRPPLPPGTGVVEPIQQAPQRSRPLSQPYKTKMRSR